jgi:beta-lactam-binding protein with PASTA domain
VSLLVAALIGSAAIAAPRVVGYELVSKTISSRTTVDFTYRIRVENGTPALTNVTATVTSSAAATVIREGVVNIASLPANATTKSVDTFTLRQNRTVAYNPAALSWTFVGSVSVPNVVGLTQAAATTSITNAGLVVGDVTQQSSANVPAGNVISQAPAGGASVAAGSAVDLVVSTGPAPVSVPNVVGLTQAAASTAITNAGLVVGTVTQQSSANVPAGNVISQDPAGGASVAAGSAVDLVVSTGPAPVSVPNVVGLTQAAATTAITNAGLVVGTVTQQSSANVPAGSVISQDPASGASVAAGSAVDLVVSTGPAPVSVPNVVGLTQAAATTAITNAGLVVGNVTQQSSANVPAGSVISQDPAGGASVAAGSAVDLVVSTGPAPVSVPNVVGLTQAAASTAITNAGLVVGTVTQQSSANVPAGNVISQDPAAGASVAAGSEVDLVISSGPPPNNIPIARAGDDSTVTVGDTASLNGATSSDADNDPLAFTWSFVSVPAGNTATLANADTPIPSFVPNVAGEYLVQLVVNDGKANSAPDQVKVTAQAAAGGSVSQDVGPAGATLQLGENVTLDIPAGALDANVRITIKEIALPPGSILPPNSVLASKVYSLEPDGQTFEQPVLLTIATDPARLPAGGDPADALIVRLLPTGQFAIVQNTTDDEYAESHLQDIDPVDGTVSVRLEHFSAYSTVYSASAAGFLPETVNVAGVAGTELVIRRPAGPGTGFRTTKPISQNCATTTDTVALPIRAAGDITAILLHSTNGGRNHTFNGELGYATNGCNQIFAHYYIDRGGEIYQIVDDLAQVNHTLPGTYTNGNSIGIEMINNLGEPYDGAQVNAAIRLVNYLMALYNLPRPQRSATTGLLTRNSSTDRVISHSENVASKCPAVARKCDPIGNFQSSGTRTYINAAGALAEENIPNGDATAPSLIDMVADAVSVMQRDRNHTGVVNSAGGDSIGAASGGKGGAVVFSSDGVSAPAYPGADRANHAQLVVGPTETVTFALPSPPSSDFTDVIVAGRLELNQDTEFNVSGSLYLAPSGVIVVRDGDNGGNLELRTRGPAILQGLIDLRGVDADAAAGTKAGGDGGELTVTYNSNHNFLLPAIIARGGDTDVNLAGGAGGNVTIFQNSGLLMVGGGTGPRPNLADTPNPRSRSDFATNDPDFTATFTAANSIFPSHSGDKLPPPAPFNLGTVGYPRPVAGQRTPLIKSNSQDGFLRGILTSGGMGGFGSSGVNLGRGGTGGAGGNISINVTDADGVSFRDVDLVTGGDVETTASTIIVDTATTQQITYFAPSGSLGGKATTVSGTAGRAGDGGVGGAAGSITLQGTLVPAQSSVVDRNRIIGFTNPTLAPLKPTSSDNPTDTSKFSIGVTKQYRDGAGQSLYRLRLDDTGKLLGGSGGIPGGGQTNPGSFGTLGAGGTITGLPH